MEKYEEPIRKIQEGALNLNKLNENIKRAIIEWDQETVWNIATILNNLRNTYNLGCKAGLNCNCTPKSACLVLPEPGEKIILNSDQRFDEQVKHDGYLCYSLGMNGKVNVWIHYPPIKDIENSIPKIINTNEVKDIKNLTPIIIDTKDIININEELIAGHLITFLNKMLEYKTIGKPTVLYGLNNIIYNLGLNE